MTSIICRASIRGATRQSPCRGQNVLVVGCRRRLSSYNTNTLLPGETAKATNNLRPGRSGKWVWVVLGLSTWGAYRSVEIVETGQVAVVEILGIVQDNLLQPGHHFLVPWAKVTKFNLQQRQVTIPTKTRIKGGLFVEIELLVLYKLDPAKVKDIYVQVGTQKDQRDWHLESVARSILHAAVARKSMEQMHDTQQLEVAREIQSKLTQLYQNEGIVIEQVFFQRVQLPTYLVDAIQDLHQLDLDISAEKRVVDGKLSVARTTAAARAVLMGENPNKVRAPVLRKEAAPKSLKPVMSTAKESKVENGTTNETKAMEGEKDAKEKTFLERYLPYLYNASDKSSDSEEKAKEKTFLKRYLPSFSKDLESGGDSSTKKLPTIKAYTRQVKEDRKTSSYFPSFFAKEGKAQAFMDSVKQEQQQSTKHSDDDKSTTEYPSSRADNKTNNNNNMEEAKLVPLKADVKQELKNPEVKNDLEQSLQSNKPKAEGKTEEES